MSASKQSASVSIDELVRRTEWVMRRNEKLLLAEGRISPDFYFGRGAGSMLNACVSLVNIAVDEPLSTSGRAFMRFVRPWSSRTSELS